MHVGWDGVRRVHGCVVHIDIIDAKVWIQYDGTSSPVADALLAAGIPREAIVLGFHPPERFRCRTIVALVQPMHRKDVGGMGRGRRAMPY
jgi:XisI protein